MHEKIERQMTDVKFMQCCKTFYVNYSIWSSCSLTKIEVIWTMFVVFLVILFFYLYSIMIFVINFRLL